MGRILRILGRENTGKLPRQGGAFSAKRTVAVGEGRLVSPLPMGSTGAAHSARQRLFVGDGSDPVHHHQRRAVKTWYPQGMNNEPYDGTESSHTSALETLAAAAIAKRKGEVYCYLSSEPHWSLIQTMSDQGHSLRKMSMATLEGMKRGGSHWKSLSPNTFIKTFRAVAKAKNDLKIQGRYGWLIAASNSATTGSRTDNAVPAGPTVRDAKPDSDPPALDCLAARENASLLPGSPVVG